MDRRDAAAHALYTDCTLDHAQRLEPCRFALRCDRNVCADAGCDDYRCHPIPSHARLKPFSARCTSACPLWAKSGPHCGSSSFGKFFMPLGTAILRAVIKLLGEPGLGATTLTPTTRTAVTIKAMDSVWRMAMSRASRTCDSINAQSEHLCYSPRHAGDRGLALLWRRPEECARRPASYSFALFLLALEIPTSPLKQFVETSGFPA